MDKIVYAHTVEGLFKRALGSRVAPGLKAELAGLGVDLDAAPRDVARTVWAQCLAAAVRHLFRDVPADEGYYRLGRALIDGYGQTVLGRAIFATFRLLGPDRALKRAVVLIRNGNNYIESRLTPVAPRRYEFWVNEHNGNPHYVRGVVTAGLEMTGARNPKCDVTSFDEHQATYVAYWE